MKVGHYLKQVNNMNYTDKEILLIKQRAYEKGRVHGVAIAAVTVLIQTMIMIFS